jgi:hypothetical protein
MELDPLVIPNGAVFHVSTLGSSPALDYGFDGTARD